MKRKLSVFCSVLAALIPVIAGCFQMQGPCGPEQDAGKEKFRRLYGFCTPQNEDDVKKLASIGVKGVCTSTKPENIALLHKYGIEAYAGFGPVGVHSNVLTDEEEALLKYYMAKDLPEKMPWTERNAVTQKRLLEADYSYGGEPLPGKKEIFWEGKVLCIIGEKARAKACERLTKICAQKGIDGVAFDYVGYANYYGCQHPDCLKLCAEYLKKHDLADTKENRNKFYLFELTEYYRVCAEHIKKIDPALRVMAHLYPVFTPHPLYGNQLKIDIAGETCAWYRLWDLEKVEKYAKSVRQNQHKYYSTTECVPFIGFTKNGLIDKKDAARIEQELRAILRSGTDAVMVHELRSVLAVPEVLAVFQKYYSAE